jgi:Spherulation-specific family 4
MARAGSERRPHDTTGDLGRKADPATPHRGGRHTHRKPRTRRPRVIVLITAIVLIAAVGVGVRVVLENGPACEKSVVPAYFYPGADWTAAIDSHPAPGLMILDITKSGAGSSPDRTYQATVKRAQAAGITIMGYANTDYAHRPLPAVEADITHYKTWYGVTDIFLDQTSSSSGDVTYYRRLSGYAHALNPGSAVMLNAGTFPEQQYMSIGDIVVVFENTYASYANLQVPGWVYKYPATRFAHIIYAVPGSQLVGAIGLAGERHAGYVYVTDGTGVRRYNQLPSYWSREDAVIAGCAPIGTRAADGTATP